MNLRKDHYHISLKQREFVIICLLPNSLIVTVLSCVPRTISKSSDCEIPFRWVLSKAFIELFHSTFLARECEENSDIDNELMNKPGDYVALSSDKNTKTS